MKQLYLCLSLLISLSSMAQYGLYGTASLNSGTIELTQAVNSSVGGAYDTVNIVNLNHSFTMRFFVNLGTKDGNGADGLTFLFRDIHSPNLAVFGASGGGLGVRNLVDNFICVEFDTYYNGNYNDPLYDHLAIMTKTVHHGKANSNLAGPVAIDSAFSNIEDGNQHEIGIKWDAVKFEMRVYFDCDLKLTLKKDLVNSIFNGDSLVYYGATASTGGLNNLQTILFDPEIKTYDTINAGCGDTVLMVNFPEEMISCQSISPDGTEFRLQDSTARSGTFYSGKYVGVKSAEGVGCSSTGQTDQVRINLLEPLYKGYYVLRIKKGSDQTTLSPFCNQPDLGSFNWFDVPEFTFIVVKVDGAINVNIVDSNDVNINPPGLTVCLPKLKPFPYLKANSAKADSWIWRYNNDTIYGQNVDFTWAVKEGNYKVLVRGPFNCTGADSVEVIFDSIPQFFFEVPDYCDKQGEIPGLPDQIIAPVFDPPWPGAWEWHITDSNLIYRGDTLEKPYLIDDVNYTLKYIKPPKVSGGESCVSEYSFTFNRNNYPPQDPLFVAFSDSLVEWCSDNENELMIYPWHKGLRKKYAPLEYLWLKNSDTLLNSTDSLHTSGSALYYLIVKDTLGCWGKDSVTISEIDRRESFTVYCDIPYAGAYRFSWEIIDEARGYEVSYDHGKIWQVTSDFNFHIVFGQNNANEVMIRALVPDACQYSLFQYSEECPELNILIPNVITPNKDGLNESFSIEGLEAFPNSKLEIFDRWGNLIFESSNYLNDWKGEGYAEGIYFYTLYLNDFNQRSFKGNFSILR